MSYHDPCDKTPDEIIAQEEPEVTEQDIVQEVPDVDETRETLSDAEVLVARAKASRLLEKHPQLMGAGMSMTAARQLYNLATYALNRDLEALGVKQETGILAMIMESMNELAMRKFDRREVVDRLQRYALPWAAAELHCEEAEMARQREASQAKETALRSDLPVPLGFARDLVDGEQTLNRARTTVIAGLPHLVRLLLDKAVNTALLTKDTPHSPRVVVVRLVSEMLAAADRSVQAMRGKAYVSVGASLWTACAEHPAQLARFLFKILKRTYKNRCDLLVVDEIGQAQKELMPGAPAESTAASAQRAMRKWADQNHAALLCGMSLEKVPEKLDSHGWQQLEVYTDLRVVTARPAAHEAGKTAICLYNPWKGGEETAFALFTISNEAVQP